MSSPEGSEDGYAHWAPEATQALDYQMGDSPDSSTPGVLMTSIQGVGEYLSPQDMAKASAMVDDWLSSEDDIGSLVDKDLSLIHI